MIQAGRGKPSVQQICRVLTRVQSQLTFLGLKHETEVLSDSAGVSPTPPPPHTHTTQHPSVGPHTQAWVENRVCLRRRRWRLRACCWCSSRAPQQQQQHTQMPSGKTWTPSGTPSTGVSVLLRECKSSAHGADCQLVTPVHRQLRWGVCALADTLHHAVCALHHRFWQEHGPDYEHGGFHGTLSLAGDVVPPTTKGLVQQTRHIWCAGSVCYVRAGAAQHQQH